MAPPNNQKAPELLKAFDWDRFTILAMIVVGVLLAVAPFYALYWRLVQRLLPSTP